MLAEGQRLDRKQAMWRDGRCPARGTEMLCVHLQKLKPESNEIKSGFLS